MALRRNRISPDLMEALQMLKFSYNHGHELNFTAGMSETDGFARLAQLTDDQSSVPEELSNFISSLGSTDHINA